MPGSKLGRGQPRLPDLEEPDPDAQRKPDRASRIFPAARSRVGSVTAAQALIRSASGPSRKPLYAEEAVVTASSVTRCGLHHDVASITLSVSGVVIAIGPAGLGGGKTGISRVEGVGDR